MNVYEEVQEEDNNVIISSKAEPVVDNLSLAQQDVQTDPIVDQDLGNDKQDAFEKLDSDVNSIEK